MNNNMLSKFIKVCTKDYISPENIRFATHFSKLSQELEIKREGTKIWFFSSRRIFLTLDHFYPPYLWMVRHFRHFSSLSCLRWIGWCQFSEDLSIFLDSFHICLKVRFVGFLLCFSNTMDLFRIWRHYSLPVYYLAVYVGQDLKIYVKFQYIVVPNSNRYWILVSGYWIKFFFDSSPLQTGSWTSIEHPVSGIGSLREIGYLSHQLIGFKRSFTINNNPEFLSLFALKVKKEIGMMTNFPSSIDKGRYLLR